MQAGGVGLLSVCSLRYPVPAVTGEPGITAQWKLGSKSSDAGCPDHTVVALRVTSGDAVRIRVEA